MIQSIGILFHYHKWNDATKGLEHKIKTKLRVENHVDIVLDSQENWEAVQEYITKVIRLKENDDRMKEQEGIRF